MQASRFLPGLLLMLFVLAAEASEIPPAFEGRRLFTSYCQLCHCPDGKGDGPLAKALGIEPADLTTTVRSRSDTVLRKIITGEGRQFITGRTRHNIISDQMPEWKGIFTDEQVDALIAYLRFLSTKKHDLMGDPERGMRLYRKYCAVCHGEEGDGHGVMTRLIGLHPMDHTNPNETDRLDNEAMVHSILEGKGFMPAWKGILSREDAEALVSYIRLLSRP